jgi:hypothetical protein
MCVCVCVCVSGLLDCLYGPIISITKPNHAYYSVIFLTTSRDGLVFHIRDLNGICFSKWHLILHRV